MPAATIDVLLNMKSNKPNLGNLTSEFEKLEKRAKRLQQGIDAALGGGGRGELARRFQTQLDGVNKKLAQIDATARKMALEKKFLAAKDAANKLRESMQRVQQIGQRMTVAGAVILGTLTLIGKKYLDTLDATLADQEAGLGRAQEELDTAQKELDTLSKKADVSQEELQTAIQARDLAASNVNLRKSELADYQKQNEAGIEFLTIQGDIALSMERIGQVIVEQVLPYAQQFAVFMQGVADFAEKNPGVVVAALTIGTTLAILGQIIVQTASLVSAVATLQGLAAQAGLASLKGAGAVPAGAGISLAGLTPIIVAALAIWAGGNLGLAIGNAIAGTNQTWDDILLTIKQLYVMAAAGFDNLLNFFGVKSNLAKGVFDLLGMGKKTTTATTGATSQNPLLDIAQAALSATKTSAAKAVETNKSIETLAVQHNQNMIDITAQGFAQEVAVRTNIQNETFQELIKYQQKGFREQLSDWVKNQQAGTKAQAAYMGTVAKFTSDFYATLAKQVSAFNKAMGTSLGAQGVSTPKPGYTIPKGSRAIGGYVDAGLYNMHAGEFVMNATSTRNAERAIGGRLTQGAASSYMTNNINLANGETIAQRKRAMRESENRSINRMMSIVTG